MSIAPWPLIRVQGCIRQSSEVASGSQFTGFRFRCHCDFSVANFFATGGQNFIDQRNQMLKLAGSHWRHLRATYFFRCPSADVFKRWPLFP